ncbi:DHA2 family efflux MFS transporter permease subunit [Streptomyces sp. NPDC096339]|uniref:DHA2 family efflux MFS transporter permease subunit n=1 Tax=Streptomyces sp. NPDC096339 TaxID=3366086 RepID=UPI0038211F27
MNKLRGNPWAVLATLGLGFFMTLLDLTIVNIAIPDMMERLGSSLDEALWVVSAYALVLAVTLITFGRLGDLRGPRTLFAAGVVLFTLASIACGLAAGPGTLIATRAVQGLGAAMMVPQTMVMIVAVFPADRRGAAMGVWGSIAGVATISGPTLGGLIVSTVGWRWIFFINVPVGIAVLALTFMLVPDIRPARAHKFDVVGVLIVTAALFCLSFGLQEGERYDWNAGIMALIAGGVALLGVFVLHQRRKQEDEPLVPFALFRDRNFTVMTVIVALISMALLGLVLPMNIYLQSVLGMSAVQAGLTLAPSPLLSMLTAPFAGRMSDRIGGKYVLLFGLAVYGIGISLVLALAAVDSRWYTFTLPMAVVGLGTGCLLAPMATEAMRGVPPRLAGAASGVNNTIRQIGSVLGASVVGAVLQSRLATTLHEEAANRSGDLPAQSREGFVAAFSHGASPDAGVLKELAAGLPGQAARQLADAAQAVYSHGFVTTMNSTLVLPLGAVAGSLLLCLAAKNHLAVKKASGATGASAPTAPPRPEPAR